MEDKKYFTICITRTCGSGGTTIAKKLADAYGIDLYDRKLLRLASEDSGISEAMFAQADEDVKNSLLYKVSRKVYNGELIPPESGNFVSDQNLFNYQAKVLKELSERESYVVVGRCADYALSDFEDSISVFIHADLDKRIRRIARKFELTDSAAKDRIQKTDKRRASYYNYYTSKKWGDASSYNLSLDSGELGIDGCVQLIKAAVEIHNKRLKR